MARISSDKLEIMPTDDIIFTLKTGMLDRIPSSLYDDINNENDSYQKSVLRSRVMNFLINILAYRVVDSDNVILQNYTNDTDNYLLHLLVYGPETINVKKCINYAESWDNIMLVVDAINLKIKHGVEGRDAMYTINYLLNWGYKFGSDKELPLLPLTLENLYARCVMYAKSSKLFTIESSFVDLA